jgi:hypothetical protein
MTDVLSRSRTHPSKLCETAGPAAEGKDTQPEENTALDPVCDAIEYFAALLFALCQYCIYFMGLSETYKESGERRDSSAQRDKTDN